LPFDAQPLDAVAGLQVDDLQAAARRGAFGGEGLVQGQAAEGLIATGAGKAHDRVIAGERQPAEIAGAAPAVGTRRWQGWSDPKDPDYDGDGRVFNTDYSAFLADFGSTRVYSEPQS
jgi:hypothetical protein